MSSHFGCCRKSGSHHFIIRLAGLQNGLLSKLHRLLWDEALFKLEDGTEVKGTIVSVGSNFVEVLLEDANPKKNETTLQEGDEELATDKREHPIGRSLIFPIDKIEHVEAITN